MTEIYIADTSSLGDDEVFREKYTNAPIERRQKIDLQKGEHKKRLSLGAWLLLEYALGKKGINSKDIALDYSSNGKPFLPEYRHIHFNLSHSESRVMCTVSDEEVGCDTEYIRPISPSLAQRYFHPDEAAVLNSLTAREERQKMLFRLWTLKESYMKATGLGFSLPMRDFCISIEKNGAVLKRTAPQIKSEFYFKEFFMDDGYCYSCCAASPDFGKPEEVKL